MLICLHFSVCHGKNFRSIYRRRVPRGFSDHEPRCYCEFLKNISTSERCEHVH